MPSAKSRKCSRKNKRSRKSNAKSLHTVVITRDSVGHTARIRRAVYNGCGWRWRDEGKAVRHTATAGGLTKSKLKISASTGTIVSRAASARAKRTYSRNGLSDYQF
jgi:hypothetical protein